MKCYYHIDREAVAFCQSCGKALCQECASKYNPCMCDECVDRRIRQQEEEKQQAKREQNIYTVKSLIKCLLFGLLGILISYLVVIKGLGGFNGSEAAALMALSFFAPFGWIVLNKIRNTLFANWGCFMSIFGIIFWTVVKALVSFVIGIPCFIIVLVKILIDHFVAKSKI